MFSTWTFRVPEGDSRGALLVEYGLLLLFVAFAAILALAAFGVSVFDLYTDNAERFTDAAPRNVG